MINENVENLIFIPLLFIFLFLQITFIPQLFPENCAPNIILILLIAAAVIDAKSANIFFVSFFVGFIMDIFSGDSFGFITLGVLSAIFVSSYLSYYFLKELFSRNLIMISVSAVLAYNAAYIFLISIGDFYQTFSNIRQFLFIIFFQIIYALILIYPLTYILLSKNEKRLFHKK